MDKVLRPDKLEVDTQTPDAPAIFKFWQKTLQNHIDTSFSDKSPQQKLSILTQYLTYKTYPIIEEATTYEHALRLLQAHFVKTKNVCYARHLLNSRKQKPEESIDEFIISLRQLAKEGNYLAVNAKIHQDEAIRDSFISGLKSKTIRQRILEAEVTLQQDIDQALSMEMHSPLILLLILLLLRLRMHLIMKGSSILNHQTFQLPLLSNAGTVEDISMMP